MNPLSNCRIINLPKISDNRGDLTVVESHKNIPFDIKRVYYLYNIPSHTDRGAHGHKKLQQLMIPISGSFDIHLDDGIAQKTFHLDKPYQGLYIPPMLWRVLTNFSSDAVCMVLASDYYAEQDYYRDYQHFLSEIRS